MLKALSQVQTGEIYPLKLPFRPQTRKLTGAISASSSEVHINGSNIFERNSANIGGEVRAANPVVVLSYFDCGLVVSHAVSGIFLLLYLCR